MPTNWINVVTGESTTTDSPDIVPTGGSDAGWNPGDWGPGGPPMGNTNTNTNTDTNQDTPPPQEDINVDENTQEPEPTESEDATALQDADDASQLEYEKYISDLEAASNTMEENNKAYIEEIRRSFEIRKQQMAQLNRASLAGVTKAGIRSGRQRYASEINTGILTAEESAGIQRLAELDAQEKMLILEAKMAMDEKSMQMLDKKYAAIKERQKEKEALILQLRQISIQEEQRNMNKMRFQREKAQWEREDATTRLESMFTAGVGLESLSNEDMDKFEADLGLMSGTFEGFYNSMLAAQKADAMKNDIALQKSIIDLLNVTPDNMEITIGDSTYMGLKDNVDRYTYTEIKGNTKYEVAIDKRTGAELWRKNAGQAYKPTQGPTPVKVTESLAKALGIPISYIGTAIKDLPEEYQNMVLEDTGNLTNSDRKNELINFIEEQNLIGSDDKVSWETYLAMQQTWINNDGTEASFKTNFPVGTWLDEDNQEELAIQLKGE